MPIENNIVLINGAALRPAPEISISNEKFTSGDYIIGGFLKVQLSGQLIGSSSSNLNSKINTITSYHSKCLPIVISCGGNTVVDGDGFFRNISISPSDQPFMVSYSIDIEVTRNFGSKSIKPDDQFTDLYDISIPDSLHLFSYEESLSLSTTDDLGKTGIFGETFTKPSLKLTGSISVQTHNAMCSDTNSDTMLTQLYTLVESRAQKILGLNPALSATYPILGNYIDGTWSAIHDTKSLSINKLDNKIDWRFDMFIYKGSCNPKAIVTIEKTESTDQLTGLSSFSLKGTIKGLADSTSNAIDNKILSSDKLINAYNIYTEVVDGSWIGSYYGYKILGCKTAASLPGTTCYQRSSAQVTQNSNSGEISFNATYADVESCQMGGTQIDISITENRPALNYASFIVPNRGYPLVQISTSQTPLKIEVTASGKLNSCNTSLMGDLINCVQARLNDAIADNGYAGYLLEQEEETIGKYTYSITRRYIACE